MKAALTYALSAGIRTAAQTASGLLGAVMFVDISELGSLGNSLVVIVIGSLLSGVAAFLMNLAEMLQVSE